MAAFKISFHSGSGQYVKYIGKKDGKPKAWYLGINADDALSKALALKKRWEAITANGGCDWNDEAKEIGKPTEIAATAKSELSISFSKKVSLDNLLITNDYLFPFFNFGLIIFFQLGNTQFSNKNSHSTGIDQLRGYGHLESWEVNVLVMCLFRISVYQIINRLILIRAFFLTVFIAF